MVLQTAQHAYGQSPIKWYSSKGKVLSFNQVSSKLATADVILYGELHNNPYSHYIEQKLLDTLHTMTDSLVLGLEMFERDDQLIFDEVFKGFISQDVAIDQLRKWSNFKTDYKPIIENAWSRNIQVVASNVPRRYARAVSQKGLSVLSQFSELAQNYFYHLDSLSAKDQKNYESVKKMLETHMGENVKKYVQAQALKDATMAESILNYSSKNSKVLHLHGNMHSKNKLGIAYYLKKMDPTLNIMVISTVESDSLKWQNQWTQMGDVVLVIDQKFPKSY